MARRKSFQIVYGRYRRAFSSNHNRSFWSHTCR